MFLELGANQFYLRGQGRERSLFLAHYRVSCTIDCITLTTRIYVCHSSHPCLPEDFPPKNQLLHSFKMIFAAFVRKSQSKILLVHYVSEDICINWSDGLYYSCTLLYYAHNLFWSTCCIMIFAKCHPIMPSNWLLESSPTHKMFYIECILMDLYLGPFQVTIIGYPSIIHSKSEQICGVYFSAQKYWRNSA